MALLINSPGVQRANNLGYAVSWYDAEHPVEQDLVVAEPTFLDFKTADNGALGAPFKLADAGLQPKTLILNFSYSKANAKVFKGYLMDVLDEWKLRYKFATSMHIPFESYGCPMVGSVLSLIFCNQMFAYTPEKRAVYPGTMFPGLLYHAPNGRMGASTFRGMSAINGYLDSARNFLPDIALWADNGLSCEYREGNTVSPQLLRDADIELLFGVIGYPSLKALNYCTPAAILSTYHKIQYL